MRLSALSADSASRTLRRGAYLVPRERPSACHVGAARGESKSSTPSHFATCRNRRTSLPAASRPKPKALVCARRRLLSLDFDGVLHPGSQIATRLNVFCWLPDLLALLGPHKDVDVLVHSSWRYEYDDSELRELLGPLGPRFVGAAPLGPRYESITWWLSRNPTYAGDYRILDDDLAEFPDPPPAELVWCPPSAGVTALEVRAALKLWLERDDGCKLA